MGGGQPRWRDGNRDASRSHLRSRQCKREWAKVKRLTSGIAGSPSSERLARLTFRTSRPIPPPTETRMTFMLRDEDRSEPRFAAARVFEREVRVRHAEGLDHRLDAVLGGEREHLSHLSD